MSSALTPTIPCFRSQTRGESVPRDPEREVASSWATAGKVNSSVDAPWHAEAKRLAGNDRQDIHQRAEGLVGLGQLGKQGAVGSGTGQQEVRLGELGPLQRPGAVVGSYHVRAAA